MTNLRRARMHYDAQFVIWNLSSLIPLRCKHSGLRIPKTADSGHGSGLAQTHVTVVLDVIFQPARNAGAASTGRISSHCGGSVRISFFGVAVVFGVPVSIGLAIIAATRFPEKEGKRERDPETHISSFSRTCETKKGADTEKENQNFLHGGANRRPLVSHKAGQKGSTARPYLVKNQISRKAAKAQ